MEPTPDLSSAVAEREPLRLEKLRALVDLYAAGRLSLGRFDRAGRALLRKKENGPMIQLARAFVAAAVLLAVACGTPPEQPAPALPSTPAAHPGCRILATIDGLRCLPDDKSGVFWESDNEKRVFETDAHTFCIFSPDPVRWVFFLTAGEPSTIRQIVLVPRDAWRDSPTKIVVPHSLQETTIPLDWFGSYFQ